MKMVSLLNFSWTQSKQIRVIAYWLLVFAIVFAIYGISNNAAYAGGTVPPNAINEYPGMDSRLVGVPIVETDLTAALVGYSEAVAKVNNLETEKSTLLSRIELLGPERMRASAIADKRAEEFDQIEAALSSLVLAQYQDISTVDGPVGDSASSNELRLTHQSTKVSESLRQWKKKAQTRKVASEKYVKKVTDQLAKSKDRTKSIDEELVGANKAARERKDVIKSGIPVALIEGLDIPVLTLDAYLRAEKVLAQERPTCGITWWALAAIGRAESNHGLYGGRLLDQTGTVSPPIIGVALNGEGFAAIGDSDGGLLDGDTEWDRAVGVMQFIPGTWKGYGADGNGDGVIDPQNVYDAVLAAGNLLCANAIPDMKTDAGRRTAYLRYNYSKPYADFVETRGHEYEAIGAGRFNPAVVDVAE